MSYIFADDVNFNYNLTSKLRHDNLITFPSLTAAEKGFVFFHTANNKFYGWTGTTWIDFSLGAGGGDVFLATTQTFTGYKTFSGGILINDSLAFIKRAVNITSSSQGLVYFKTDNTFNISVGTGAGAHNATFDGIDAFTAARTFTLPDANGTFALQGDFVDLTTSQIIAGEKVFTDPTTVESLVFTQDGDPFLVAFGLQHKDSYGFTFQDNTLGGGQPFSFKGQGLTAIRVQTIQNKSGTLAHLDDIVIPYRGRVQTTAATATVSYNVLTSGNIELTTGSQATIDVSFTSESSAVGFPILIRLRSTRVGGTTYTFTSGIYNNVGTNGFDVIVAEGGEVTVHFVIADSSSTVATNY
jgi:hypothetical protein